MASAAFRPEPQPVNRTSSRPRASCRSRPAMASTIWMLRAHASGWFSISSSMCRSSWLGFILPLPEQFYRDRLLLPGGEELPHLPQAGHDAAAAGALHGQGPAGAGEAGRLRQVPAAQKTVEEARVEHVPRAGHVHDLYPEGGAAPGLGPVSGQAAGRAHLDHDRRARGRQRRQRGQGLLRRLLTRDRGGLGLVGQEQVDVGQQVADFLPPPAGGVPAGVQGGGPAPAPGLPEQPRQLRPQRRLQVVGPDVQVVGPGQALRGHVGAPGLGRGAGIGGIGALGAGGKHHRHPGPQGGIDDRCRCLRPPRRAPAAPGGRSRRRPPGPRSATASPSRASARATVPVCPPTRNSRPRASDSSSAAGRRSRPVSRRSRLTSPTARHPLDRFHGGSSSPPGPGLSRQDAVDACVARDGEAQAQGRMPLMPASPGMARRRRKAGCR